MSTRMSTWSFKRPVGRSHRTALYETCPSATPRRQFDLTQRVCVLPSSRTSTVVLPKSDSSHAGGHRFESCRAHHPIVWNRQRVILALRHFPFSTPKRIKTSLLSKITPMISAADYRLRRPILSTLEWVPSKNH